MKERKVVLRQVVTTENDNQEKSRFVTKAAKRSKPFLERDVPGEHIPFQWVLTQEDSVGDERHDHTD